MSKEFPSLFENDLRGNIKILWGNERWDLCNHGLS